MVRRSDQEAPAGQLPALEHGLDLVEGVGDEFASARTIIEYLRSHGSDLDAHLTTVQARQDFISNTTFLSSVLHSTWPSSCVLTCSKRSCWLLLHLWRANWSPQHSTQHGARQRAITGIPGQHLPQACRSRSITGFHGINEEQSCGDL